MSVSHPDTTKFSSAPYHTPLAFAQNLMASNQLQTGVSKFAQESLREVKRLRILLTRLLVAVDNTADDLNEEDGYLGPEEDEKRTHILRSGPSPSPNFDDKAKFTNGLTNWRSETLGSAHLHKTVLQISDVLDTLDHLAALMHNTRANTRTGELGMHQALGFLTALDQLEFSSGPISTAEYGDAAEDSLFMETEPRRTNWLLDRSDAERWSNRYWERTHTILRGLLTCSVFRRSHVNADHKRHRLDAMSSRDLRSDLEHLLNDIHTDCPKLTITLLDGGPNLNAAHVKVAEVMQCFVTFRRLHPEHIVVRGLTEGMILKSISTGATATEAEPQLSASLMEEHLSSYDVSGATKETLIFLVSPDRSPRTATDARSRRGGAAQFGQRPILTSSFGIQQLDLVTPSRFLLFKRITTLAQCAILHFSNDYQPPSAVRGLFHWLHSYHDLFTSPCGRCGQLLGQDVSLPVWRSYPQLRKDDSRAIVPQHEHCQAVA